MKISRSKTVLVNLAVMGAAALGSAAFAAKVGVQTDAPEDLAQRVKDALRSDPYFYDAHVTVSVDHGAVVLDGFVSSEWDLRDAIRIASNAAGDRRVVDNLSITLGGNR